MMKPIEVTVLQDKVRNAISALRRALVLLDDVQAQITEAQERSFLLEEKIDADVKAPA